MKEWLFHQIYNLNILAILVISIYVTAMSKADTKKMLKDFHEEMYNNFEEIKDEIRGSRK
jgi:hypothetical protein